MASSTTTRRTRRARESKRETSSDERPNSADASRAGPPSRPCRESTRTARSLRKFGPLLLVGVLAFAAYANTLSNGFVLDDEHQVLLNPWIQDSGNLRAIFSSGVWEFTGSRSVTDYYRPMMHILYLATERIFGLEAWAFHLVNVLFHVANSLLVFVLCARLWRRPGPGEALAQRGATASVEWMPLLAAALFATHPAHTEAVAWIASLPELSFSLFFLLALIAHVGRDPQAGPRAWAPLLFFGAALLCKETAVTLPAVLIGYDLIFLSSEQRSARGRRGYLAYLALVAVYLAVRHAALAGPRVTVASPWQPGPWQFLLAAVDLFRDYLATLFSPFDLSFWHAFHPPVSIADPTVLLSILVLVLFMAGAWWAWRKNRLAAFGFLLFALPLAPAFLLTAFPAKPFAERYLYLPSVGWVLVVGLLLERLAARNRAKPLAVVASLALLTAFTWATVMRNRVWKDSFSLYVDTRARTSDMPIPPPDLAATLLEKGRFDEAIALWRILVTAEPGSADHRSALGSALLRAGRVDEAAEELSGALDLDPESDATLNDLAIARRRQGRVDEAAELYRRALAANPRSAEAHFNLAGLLAEKGAVEEALEHYRSAVLGRPENAYYQSVLAIELARADRLAEALQHFEAAVRLAPDEPAYRKNLERARGRLASETAAGEAERSTR